MERGKWSAKMDFILSAVGYAVGLGNIWRFPYLCFINGGGAFLIPYFFMMTFAGLPLFYLELAIGQYASLGPISIWKFCPLFKGIGYSMMGINMLVSIYYNVILSISIFYLFASFTNDLPWTDCGHYWNKRCSIDIYNDSCQWRQILNSSNQNMDSNECISPNLNITLIPSNFNSTTPPSLGPLKTPAEEYWLYYVLGVNNDTSISNIGSVRWHLTLCNLLAWIIVYLCIIQGVKSSGKVVYFTATFPYVVLFILFIRGVTLPGAIEGIKFYMVPDFEKMAHVKVWNDAAIQILFSLGPGFGSLIMLGSYNNFNNKCNRDAVAVTLINCLTSFFAGFVIFSVLGFMSHTQNVPVSEVVDRGPGLAFIAYPEAISRMPGAPFWSICFFFMLITLGLDSQFVAVESIVTGLVDEFRLIAKFKKISTLIICIIIFLVGLPCVTQGGMFVIELIDQFTTSFPLLIVVFFETISLAWIYGIKRLSENIELMTSSKPNYYWIGCWIFITPVIILFIIVFKSIEFDGIYYDGVRYPAWAEGLGWSISAILIAFIPGWAIYEIILCIGSFQKLQMVLTCVASYRILKLERVIHPMADWGPVQAISDRRKDIFEERDGSEERYMVSYQEGKCTLSPSVPYTHFDESHI